MTLLSNAKSGQDKPEQIRHYTNQPKTVHFLSEIELQVAKRLKRSAAKTMLALLNRGCDFISGRS
jgi:hypothetical protein